MTANGIKEWTVSKGDFHHSDEIDYEKKFHSAKQEHKTFETKVKVFFALTGISALVLLLEFMTKF